jgi:signal transduction histidine kinase
MAIDITMSVKQEENVASRDAMELAKSVDRAKNDFLAMISHEMRTPMNGIIGCTALLRDTKLDQTQTHYLDTIQSSGEFLLALINDILDFSKIESGRMTVENEAFSIEECINRVSDLFKTEMKKKGLEYAVNIEPGIPEMLFGDIVRVTQILMNLVGNALKFTEKGGQ